jgi:GrpB-like predicted nucleotidyltransferase (UPF0157 family)
VKSVACHASRATLFCSEGVVYKTSVEVVAYNPPWLDIYQAEREKILGATSWFLEFEHIGSTAIPKQRAKPIIDMMAAVEGLDNLGGLLEMLKGLEYHVLGTDMKNRLFLRKEKDGQVFHLHIVERFTWAERKERLLRDYLLAHPEAVKAYGELKDNLAVIHKDDSVEYTKAKTAFIQDIHDKIQDARGLPRVNVWED